MQVVEALYVPKSLTIQKTATGYTVKVKNNGSQAVMIIVGFVVALFGASSAIGAGGFMGLMLYVAACAALGYYLLKDGGKNLPDFGSSNPPMLLSKEGVSIGNLMYRMEDISDFREGYDDVPANRQLTIAERQYLGLQYGLYSVKLPYLLTKNECLKVAPYLTDLLKLLTEDVGKDRERKTQQAVVF